MIHMIRNQYIEFFYDFTSTEGYHPTPSNWNISLTLLIGASAGLILGIKRIRKSKQKK